MSCPREPVFITKMDMVIWCDEYETYEEMVENTAIDTAISEAEAEFEQDGKLYDARKR